MIDLSLKNKTVRCGFKKGLFVVLSCVTHWGRSHDVDRKETSVPEAGLQNKSC